MNKYIIGAIFSICGTLLTSAILISGAIFSTAVHQWSGTSKFWYVILGKSFPNQNMYSMELSFLFFFSIAILILGIAILIHDYIKRK